MKLGGNLFEARLLAGTLLVLAVAPAACVAESHGQVGATTSVAATTAADPLFLKIDGIPGSSVAKAHAGEIDVASFGFSAEATVATTGGGAGKATLSALTFTATTSKASPPLMLAVLSGKHFKEAVLSGETATGFKYLEIKLVDAFVASYGVEGAASAIAPQELFTLRFGRIEFSYIGQDATGKPLPAVKGCWDVNANQAC